MLEDRARSASPRLRWRFGVALVALAGALLFSSAPAMAGTRYPLVREIDGSGTPNGFIDPNGLAVDGVNGDLFTTENAFAHGVLSQTLYRFDAAGAFVSATTGTATPNGSGWRPQAVAANDTTGDVYVPDSASSGAESIEVFDSSGAFLSQIIGSGVPGGLGGPGAVTADQASGDVYLYDSTHKLIDVFDSSGGYLSQITAAGTTAFSSVTGLAVDGATGDLFVADSGAHVVYEFDSSLAFVASWTGSNTPQGAFSGDLYVAANDSSGDVYVAARGSEVVDQFDSSGAYINQATGTPSRSFGPIRAITVGQVDGRLYVANTDPGSGDGVVDVFEGNAVVVPDVTTDPASTVAPGSATLTGTVNPRGVQLTDCHFDYGTSTSYGQTAPCVPAAGSIPADSNDHQVRADVSGLTPGVVYHYRLVAANANDPNPVLGSDLLVGPPRVDSESATPAKTTATLGAQVNPDGVDTSCEFEYVDDADYHPSASDPYSAGQTAPCAPADLGSGDATVAASAAISDLKAGTVYHYRVLATNAAGMVAGFDRKFTTTPAAQFDGVAITDVTPTSATVSAQINPLGDDTRYHFEWGTSTSYGHDTPIPDTDIGAGSDDVTVTAHLAGLSDNTVYHVRVVATNASGIADSGDHTFIYNTSGGGLPDNRAYEQVSPVDKNGAVIGAGLFIGAPDVAGSGQRVLVESIQCFGDTESCNANRQARGGEGALYSFERTPAGWRTTPLSPPATQFDENNTSDWHADPGAALFSATGAPGGKDQLVARRPDGSLAVIGPVEPPTADVSGPPYFVFGDRDFSHVVFGDGTADLGWSFDSTLTEGQNNTAYEYVGTGNSEPLLVGVTGGRASTDLVSQCGISLNGISRDGRMVFFSATGHEQLFLCPSSATAPPATELLARIDESRTVLLSASSPSDCTTAACRSSAPEPAVAEAVAQDGSAAAFSSTQQLTDDAMQGSRNLYVYDFTRPSGHELVDVSAGDTSGTGPDFSGAVAMSPDGSHLYFVAGGVLTARRNAFGQAPTAGANNLYVYTREANSAGEHLAFLASLPDSDSGLWSGGLGDPRARPLANVTPDGRFLVFPAHGRLTPDDVSVSGAAQVFRYDALTGQLARVSIGERGFNDNGNAGSRELCAENAADCTADAHVAPVPLSEERLDPTVSDDGRHVVFLSPAGLTPQALDYVPNGTDSFSGATQYAQNVYEWEQAGAGSCPATRSSGCVSLISDGKDTSRLVLLALAIDASGSNIFFSTVDPLVPQDTDGGQLDIYDARICTQSDPCIKPPPPPSSCDGDACQGTPSTPPPPSLAASVSFFGAGNASQPAGARVLTRTVRGARFLVRVRVPAKGRITIAGNGIRRVSRLMSQAGIYRVRVNLTPTARRALARRQRLRLRLRVTYLPAGGSTRTATVPLTVRPALRHRARHTRGARGATDANRRAGK